jgi:hypothetical protein
MGKKLGPISRKPQFSTKMPGETLKIVFTSSFIAEETRKLELSAVGNRIKAEETPKWRHLRNSLFVYPLRGFEMIATVSSMLLIC